jgi:hypothetical protein
VGLVFAVERGRFPERLGLPFLYLCAEGRSVSTSSVARADADSDDAAFIGTQFTVPRSGIYLGIGLTPFEIYLDYDSRAEAALRSKVLQLNEVQADMLCILFDDMRGDVADLPDLHGRRYSICPARRF